MRAFSRASFTFELNQHIKVMKIIPSPTPDKALEATIPSRYVLMEVLHKLSLT